MRVAMGLSGGVDSSVTAKLVQDAGHDVVGIFLKTWDSDDPYCPAAIDAADARAVAARLGIPFYSFDVSDRYRDDVFSYFIEQNKRGRTPNPDIFCNVHIKFGAFIDIARELKCEKIAMGHYAKVTEENGVYTLKTPKDGNKDQTYFLHRLTQDQLAWALFPLADLMKPEVREIAIKEGFVTAEKKDSTGICMVGDRPYRQFLQEHMTATKGDIIEADSGKRQIVGRHLGLPYYTLGQRRDLGVGGVKGFPEAPWFVVAKDFLENTLQISQDEMKLRRSAVTCIKAHWIAGHAPADLSGISAKVRYRTESVPSSIALTKRGLSVTFAEPVRSPTPGQAIVFYRDNVVLGGAEIDTTA